MISNSTYYKNLIVLTIQWSAASFSFYMLQFLNKYFEGSIYINYYLDGTAGLIGNSISLFVYPCAKIQWSFVISVSLTFVGSIFLLMFQQEYWGSSWIAPFVPERSPYPEGSEEENHYYLGYTIPLFVFITKIGVNFTFQNAY